MVSVAVIGHRGMLGRTVARRWSELGADVATSDLRYGGHLDDHLVAWAAEHDIVVNCAMSREIDDMAIVNGLLAVHLGVVCRQLIQPSTDALAEDSHYAISKRIAERADGLVIRCSLVSEAAPPDLAPVNWRWNGVTTLTWADVAWQHRNERGILTLASPPVSRYDLYSIVAEVFGYDPPEPWDHPHPTDRTLVGEAMPPIREQLEALRSWLASS